MKTDETESGTENVCSLSYLSEIMGGKKNLIKEIMDVFLKQIPEELQCINDSVAKADYPIVKSLAHTMKSSVSIMGISILGPILQEMVDLAKEAENIEKIKGLNLKLNQICMRAISEIETAKHSYV